MPRPAWGSAAAWGSWRSTCCPARRSCSRARRWARRAGCRGWRAACGSSNNKAMSSTPTVLVAGAGVVGLVAAALLATGRGAERLRVVVLDARPIPRWRADDMDPRVYALSRASQQLLAHVGVWNRVAETRAAPYRRMRVWEGPDAYAPSALDFDSADIGE